MFKYKRIKTIFAVAWLKLHPWSFMTIINVVPVTSLASLGKSHLVLKCCLTWLVQICWGFFSMCIDKTFFCILFSVFFGITYWLLIMYIGVFASLYLLGKVYETTYYCFSERFIELTSITSAKNLVFGGQMDSKLWAQRREVCP